MPDYIYLLENRLSSTQQNALQHVREAAREAGMTVFLTGGAVRDLTSGSPVRDLDVSVQGNALKLKKRLEKSGGIVWGEHEASHTIFLRFPGSVRVEVSSTRREEFPKPGKPVYELAPILDDLRRRDFTANAMALSLNEGSYGLLMDPLNGVADIEARQLRLVSNYGFLEDPIRMIRATRLAARLSWDLEEKTKTRYQNAREEGVIVSISPYQQGYELEEIVHEEDGLRSLRALEAEGWMQNLFPGWTSARADTTELDELRDTLIQLQMQGVNPDPSTAQAQLLTAKLPPKDLSALKKMFARHGFVAEWDRLDEDAKNFAKLLTGKESATPSATWKLITTHQPEAVLWLALTSKSTPVRAKFKDFFSVWPEARQRIPYALMQEMRITPELPGYQDLLRNIFFELIDGRLTLEEEVKSFLEPHSPPAPPPPVKLSRSRGKKAEAKAKIEEEEDEEEIELPVPRDDDAEEPEEDADDEDEDEISAVVKTSPKTKSAPVPASAKAEVKLPAGASPLALAKKPELASKKPEAAITSASTSASPAPKKSELAPKKPESAVKASVKTSHPAAKTIKHNGKQPGASPAAKFGHKKAAFKPAPEAPAKNHRAAPKKTAAKTVSAKGVKKVTSRPAAKKAVAIKKPIAKTKVSPKKALIPVKKRR